MTNSTINIAPDADGLVRYLRAMYHADPTAAVFAFAAGWPHVRPADRLAVLQGRMTLADAVALSRRPLGVPACATCDNGRRMPADANRRVITDGDGVVVECGTCGRCLQA